MRHDLGARLDAASTYALQLGQLAQSAATPLYGLGLIDLAPIERDFLTAYAERAPVTLFTSDTLAENATASGALLRAAWGDQASGVGGQASENPMPLFERAAALRAAIPTSPIADKLKLFGAQSLEEEALAAATRNGCGSLKANATSPSSRRIGFRRTPVACAARASRDLRQR